MGGQGYRQVLVLVLIGCACNQQTSTPRRLSSIVEPADAATAVDTGSQPPRAIVSHGFEAIPAPHEGDWLSLHNEAGQNVAEFVRDRRPTGVRTTIYIAFVPGQRRDATPNMLVLAAFARAFFGLPVKVLPTRSLSNLGLHVPSPARLDGRKLRRKLARHIPGDALALIGITDVDLTSRKIGTIFGEASAHQRVGIVSVARLHLGFYVYGAPSNKRIVLKRSLALLAHELGHALGIEHCTAYRCVMNGVASLRELDNLPTHVCPHDLRKLAIAASFDDRQRYLGLAAFYDLHSLADEAAWAYARLARTATETTVVVPPQCMRQHLTCR